MWTRWLDNSIKQEEKKKKYTGELAEDLKEYGTVGENRLEKQRYIRVKACLNYSASSSFQEFVIRF